MEVLEGTVLPFYRFGWYYRPSIHAYEFWWMGEAPKLTVSAEMIDAMPTSIANEITMGVALKGAVGQLDD